MQGARQECRHTVWPTSQPAGPPSRPEVTLPCRMPSPATQPPSHPRHPATRATQATQATQPPKPPSHAATQPPGHAATQPQNWPAKQAVRRPASVPKALPRSVTYLALLGDSSQFGTELMQCMTSAQNVGALLCIPARCSRFEWSRVELSVVGWNGIMYIALRGT